MPLDVVPPPICDRLRDFLSGECVHRHVVPQPSGTEIRTLGVSLGDDPQRSDGPARDESGSATFRGLSP
jgi:hypothetical protein